MEATYSAEKIRIIKEKILTYIKKLQYSGPNGSKSVLNKVIIYNYCEKKFYRYNLYGFKIDNILGDNDNGNRYIYRT